MCDTYGETEPVNHDTAYYLKRMMKISDENLDVE